MGRPLGSRNRRSAAMAEIVGNLSDSGMGQSEIVTRLHIAPKTVKELIAEAKATLERESAGVLQDWRTAASMGALKGLHAPAKDWLLHAGIIQHIADSKPAGPQIIIGISTLPGLPVSPVAIDVSPLPFRPMIEAESESETAGNC